MSEKGYGYQTIKNYQRSLLAVFYTAVEDNYIRKNPFRFALNTVLDDDREEKIILPRNRKNASLPLHRATRFIPNMRMSLSSSRKQECGFQSFAVSPPTWISKTVQSW